MIHIPEIVNYNPFYIQTSADAEAIDTREWGLVAKVNPYPLLPKPKAPFNNEWYDEHGDDEWNDVIYYEAFEFSVSFYIKAYDSDEGSAEQIIREKVDSFFSKIKSGEFAVYDAYNGIGRKKVRYAGYSEEEFKRRSNYARAIFSITFKVNDPVTRMTLKKGQIVAL
jgi:hypothetical protein